MTETVKERINQSTETYDGVKNLDEEQDNLFHEDD